MKKLVLTLLACSVITLEAQITKVDGPLEKAKGRFDAPSVVGADNNAFYIYRSNSDRIYVQRYNKKSLAKEWEKEIAIKEKNIEPRPWGRSKLCYLKNGLIYVYQPSADKEKKRGVLLRAILNTDGKINEEFKEVGSMNDEFIASKWFSRQGGGGSFSYRLSPDSSKMIWCVKYFINGVGTQRTISAIDLKNGKRLCDKEVTEYSDKGDRVSSIKGFAIDNDGKMAYGYIYKDGDARRFAVSVYDPATGSEKKLSPNIASVGSVVMESSDLSFVGKNKLLFTSIVTDEDTPKDKKKNSSIFFSYYDPTTGKSVSETSQYFSDEWREKYTPVKGAEGHSNYEFQYNQLSDGSLIITSYKMGGWNAPAKFGSNCLDDAVITKVTATGKIDWIKTLPIRVVRSDNFWNTVGVENYANSFLLNNKVYYIFDDQKVNEKNIDLTKVETSKYTEYTKSPWDVDVNTTCITIDASGNMQRNFICNNKEIGFYPLDKLVWIEKNKLLVYFSKEAREEEFAILTVQ